LNALAERARDGDDVGALVADSMAAITEQLDHLHKSYLHVTERLDALSNQVASLEARIHEDVE
jgi:hypothetical protein